MATDFRLNTKNTRVVISGEALDEILRGPKGPVVHDLYRRGDILQRAAKRQVRLGHIHAGGGYGNLRDSIVKRIMTTKSGGGMPWVVVGSDHPIALIHHEGTRAHIIRPVHRKALRFPGATPTGFVFAKRVKHPGTKPNRYLTDNIPLAMKG